MNANNEQTANLRHVFVHLTNKSKRFESRGTHHAEIYPLLNESEFSTI